MIRQTEWLAIVIASGLGVAVPGHAGWNPAAWADEDTIEFHTVNDGEGHGSTVWIVVLDGEPYLRLGDRAARRVEENAGAPIIRWRVRSVPHPLTVRLEPAGTG